jgi:hypothetical protein
MPMLESTAFRLTDAFGPARIDTSVAKAADFAPGKQLTATLLFAPRSREHVALTEYIELIPPAVQETLRATVYHALTAHPATPVMFVWRPAYYFSASVAQGPATDERQGAITLTLEGPFPRDANSPAQFYSASPRSGARASRKPSSSGAPKPAKRKPSTRSKKSA